MVTREGEVPGRPRGSATDLRREYGGLRTRMLGRSWTCQRCGALGRAEVTLGPLKLLAGSWEASLTWNVLTGSLSRPCASVAHGPE